MMRFEKGWFEFPDVKAFNNEQSVLEYSLLQIRIGLTIELHVVLGYDVDA